MKYIKLLIISVLLLSVACEKQEVDEPLYYFVETLPISISENEITYNGRFFTGKDSLVEYGFLLFGSNSSLQRVLIADNNQSGYFSVKDSISVNNQMSRFAQAYALSENYLNFGEPITLENEILNNPVEEIQAFSVSNITLSNATISASHSIGGVAEAMGVVLSTEPNPSLENYVRKGKLYDDVFSESQAFYPNGNVYVHRFRGLEPSTTYYTKVYLIHRGKLYYSKELSFTTLGSLINRGNGLTDIEGNHYETVQINNQEWMAENLRVSRFRNGDSILSGNNVVDWANKTIPLYAVYDHNVLDGLNNEEEVKSAFGLLYNGYTIKDSRQLCPEGWRLTTKNDWEELINYSREHLGYYINEGNFFLSESYFLTSCRNPQTTSQDCQTNVAPFWRELNYPEEQYDIFGLGLEATGYRGRFGGYESKLEYARFWLADPYDAVNHYTISINPNYRTFSRGNLLGSGNSVRCIRDLAD
jgi:uncharacterized protein (TIGR02145 family)